jgi:hypothetical protein
MLSLLKQKKEIALLRTHHLSDHVSGVLEIPGNRPFVTLEPADNQNQRLRSCIPTGEYPCRRVYKRTTYGGMYIAETFTVDNVPSRSGILFHVGNYPRDTAGCILLGTAYTGEGVIINSRAAFAEFLSALKGVEQFTLLIHDLWPSSQENSDPKQSVTH